MVTAPSSEKISFLSFSSKRRRTGALTAEHPRRDTLAFRRARRERRAATRARLLSVARALRMSPADAPDAHLHENALAEDLTGASLLRSRNVENTEKRVSNAEMRSETPSAAAIPRSAPDAREPPPPSAKHASTRRPGAILRAAERLVLAAAVEDAAAGDAVEGDGSHTQPPGGGSDDTREEARFHAPDVFDFLFERERETFGETQELARLPAAKWWTSMVDPFIPEASNANADLGLGNPRTCLGAPKERETFPPREAPPRAEAKAKAKKKKKRRRRRRRRRRGDGRRRRHLGCRFRSRALVRASARRYGRRQGQSARRARAAREESQSMRRRLDDDGDRNRAFLRGVTGGWRLRFAGGGGVRDATRRARRGGARGARDAPTGEPRVFPRLPRRRIAAGRKTRLTFTRYRDVGKRRSERFRTRHRSVAGWERAVQVQRAVSADAASSRFPDRALRPPVPLGRAARAPGARVGHDARAGGQLVHQRARAHLAADDRAARFADRGRAKKREGTRGEERRTKAEAFDEPRAS